MVGSPSLFVRQQCMNIISFVINVVYNCLRRTAENDGNRLSKEKMECVQWIRYLRY